MRLIRDTGCDVVEADGHDFEALKAACGRHTADVNAVVASTVKGYGCRTLVENQYEWHRKSPSDAEYDRLVEELDAPAV